MPVLSDGSSLVILGPLFSRFLFNHALGQFLDLPIAFAAGGYGYRRTSPELSVPLVWLILCSRTAVGEDVNLHVLVPERFSNLLYWTAQSHDSLPPFSLCFGLWEVLIGPEVHSNEIFGFLSRPIAVLPVCSPKNISSVQP
jgi:hypothetical protein